MSMYCLYYKLNSSSYRTVLGAMLIFLGLSLLEEIAVQEATIVGLLDHALHLAHAVLEPRV